MNNQDFTISLLVDQSPRDVFNAITNVRAWWSEEIEGNTEKLQDEFIYRYKDVHRCTMKLVDVIPDKKVVWLVLDNYFNFIKDTSEWKDTKVCFEITQEGDKTKLHFTHVGLVPEYECYHACSNGWTQYIHHSLYNLLTKGKGQPNSSKVGFATYEVAAQFNVLAQQERWFEIQDMFFAEDVKSIEPPDSPWLKNAEGKASVRKKGEAWVKRIEQVHKARTSEPVVGGNHFAVGREMDITVQGIGRIELNELMVYEVRGGKIVSEQFFY